MGRSSVGVDKSVELWYNKHMKYKSNTKTTRNKAIISLRVNDPSLSLVEIGEMFNISKQKVSFIIKRHYRRLNDCTREVQD
ncbi:hypothetical protein LCGC14_1451820 [marine sediment metagenome]|uniref:RNA polymerase sigma-70 region 4 domain-containing protein n=1 Tax=marine sediment metagenome TaxID=412755 RepID=A0A0F9K408_9ZZZZ